MKGFIYKKYGPPDVLKLTELDKPSPAEGQVLIKVKAAAVNAYDWRLVSATPFLVRIGGIGFFRPKHTKRQVGADVAGIIEEVGPGVESFAVGDKVFGALSPTGNGGFAEYARAATKYLAHMPKNASFEEAAGLPMAAMTALQGLRDEANVRTGEDVAISGASGGVGHYAVQIAKALGARVTAVCSGAKAQLAESLGADRVIDYKKEDFTANGHKYDVIVGVNGYHHLNDYRRALKANGRYVMAGGNTKQLLQGTMRAKGISKRSTQTLTLVREKPNAKDLEYLAELFEQGKLKTVIDRRFPLEETPQAVALVAEGHVAGKVVVSLG